MQVIFTDGLGNQMFQYAFYLSMLAHGYKPKLNIGIITRNIVHNGFELCDDFNINRNELQITDGCWFGGGITIFVLRYLKFLCYTEKIDLFDVKVFQTKKPIVSGYWQNVEYFKNISEEVRRAFTFRNIDEENIRISKEMSQIDSVSLHIRRGDYLKYPQYQICTPSYYQRAIAYIKEKLNNPVFYVFSDDLEWSHDFMDNQGVEYKIINLNRGKDSYKDMYLMSCCHHNIIANSSFSWWGAWLNNYDDKIVICPSTWNLKYEKFHPQLDEWIKINTK